MKFSKGISIKTLFIVASIFCTVNTYAGEGVIDVRSNNNVAVTADKFEAILKEKGMTVFARINHAAGAAKVGEQLRPTELVIFGNPRVGTLLMQCAQSVAIDLPQKALIWQDESGQIWISYNDPQYLVSRHAITGCDEVIAKVSGALGKFSAAASQ